MNQDKHVAADEPEKAWLDFARRHKAEGGFDSKESRYNFKGNRWVIKKEGQFEIQFNWNVLFSRQSSSGVKICTDFLFPINFSGELKLEIYPNDFFTSLLLLINSNKVKIGDVELDRKFIFVTNKSELIEAIVPEMKNVNSICSGEDFIVQIEGEKIGIEGKRILIQVNELLKEEAIIEAFYNLGAAMQQKINKVF
ncbi:MAG: hypothetical protein NT084_04480 [Bacteroidetes bacterium]|nr:hypothetical protein [Bacteroidota bacterium]